MAVPKKKTARSRSKVRYKAYMTRQWKKLLNFVEAAKKRQKGAARIAERHTVETAKSITKIEA